MGKNTKDLTMFRKASEKVVSVEDDIAIGGDLSVNMADQPGLYAYYAGQAEAALHRAKRKKYELLCCQEDLDVTIRRDLAKKKEKATEGAIKSMINRHPETRRLFEEYMQSKRVAGMLNVLGKAFEQRGDMLRSIGAMRRQEADQSSFQTLKKKARGVTSALRGDDAE